MLRRILAVVAGLVVAMAVVFLVEALGGIVFPDPPGMDPANPDSVRDNMANVTVGALAFVLAAYALGAAAGSYVVGRLIGPGDWLWGLAAGGFVMLGAIANIYRIAHPMWFVVAAPLVVIGAAFLGAWLNRPRRSSIRRNAPAA